MGPKLKGHQESNYSIDVEEDAETGDPEVGEGEMSLGNCLVVFQHK